MAVAIAVQYLLFLRYLGYALCLHVGTFGMWQNMKTFEHSYVELSSIIVDASF